MFPKGKNNFVKAEPADVSAFAFPESFFAGAAANLFAKAFAAVSFVAGAAAAGAAATGAFASLSNKAPRAFKPPPYSFNS